VLKYVLITPARNEDKYIEKALEAVVSQTILPVMWIIVSDNSTDRTVEIVQKYENDHKFIRLIHINEGKERNFSSKVHAFNLGYEQLKGQNYDYLGILDADISFHSDYYESILKQFCRNDRLGIGGGIRYDWCRGKFVKVINSPISVGGAFQLFRRQCFEDIGGFTPIDIGGEDTVAEISARMKNWEVRSFAEIKVYHHRYTGTAKSSLLKSFFLEGIKHHTIGYHPVFEVIRCMYRTIERPFVIGSVLTLCGYCWGNFKSFKKVTTPAFVRYLRREQVGRIQSLLKPKYR
jgi:glycosyltransferase involved in cell wall biosynthesis